TGAAQHFRDARITPIYEGTNGIQAIDLVTRKVLRPGSIIAERTIADFRAAGDAAGAAGLEDVGPIVIEAADALAAATTALRQRANDAEWLLCVAKPYLDLFAIAAGAAGLARTAAAAAKRGIDAHPRHAAAVEDAEFFAGTIAVRCQALARIVVDAPRRLGRTLAA
ncbi:MAG: acyl-CoA dehydrogenase C-terminal domain-containing protein, partial [Beijerinckiaceae bacterium]